METTIKIPEIRHPAPEDYPILFSDEWRDHLTWDSRGRAILFVCQSPPVDEYGVERSNPYWEIQECDPELYAYIVGLPSTYVPSIELVYGPGAKDNPELVRRYEQFVSIDQAHLCHIDPAAIAALEGKTDR